MNKKNFAIIITALILIVAIELNRTNFHYLTSRITYSPLATGYVGPTSEYISYTTESPMTTSKQPECNPGSKNSCLVGAVDDQVDTTSEYIWNCVESGQSIQCSLPIPKCGRIKFTCFASNLFTKFSDNPYLYMWSCSSGDQLMHCSMEKPICNTVFMNGCFQGDSINIPDTNSGYKWSCYVLGAGVVQCSLPIPKCGLRFLTCSRRNVGLQGVDHYIGWWTCNSGNQFVYCQDILPPEV